MSPVIVGYIGVVVLLIVFLLGMPVAFAMMSVGFVGMLYLLPAEAAFRFLAMDIFGRFSEYQFSVIPMFILMGYFASLSGMTTRLYEIAYVWIGHLRGGLSMATIVACALFSSVTGSSAATAATIGKVAYPEMKKYGYDDALSTGCIAGAGTLGPMIPPSTGMIIYGLLTEQSIGKLFLSGILPGVLLSVLFMITVTTMCTINSSLGPPGPSTPMKQKLSVLPGLLEALALFLLVVGGLFLGLFTPTQAGGAGAAGALIVGLIRRNITWKSLWESTKDALLISCMVLCLITGAMVFGHFLSLSTMSIALTEWVYQLNVSRLVVLIIVCFFYIIGGCVIDCMGLIVLTIPIVTPVIFGLGYDPIWFAVVLGLLGETGVITPPVGVNVYVLKGIIPDVPISRMFVGIIPFFFAILVGLVLIIIFPSIATFLPSLVSY